MSSVADGDEGEELSNTLVEDCNVEVANNTSQHALPTFQVGEIISVEGDTTERGYTYLFIYFLRHVFLHLTMAVKRRYKSTCGVGSIKEYVGYIEEKHWQLSPSLSKSKERERERESISSFSAFISCTMKVFRKHTG